MIRFTLITLLIYLAACNTNKTERIGFLMAETSGRWQRDSAKFMEKAAEYQATVFAAVGTSDPEVQLEKAKSLLQNDLDVLVVIPADGVKAGEIVKLAHDKRVAVISYDRIIQNVDLDYYVSFDNIRVGELQASYMVNKVPRGRYAIISGPSSDNNAILFKQGQMKVLEPLIESGDIDLVFDYEVEEWGEEFGRKATEELIQRVDSVDVIISAADILSVGVIEALRESDAFSKHDILISGQDANIGNVVSIIVGDQTMTIYKSIEAIAYTAALYAIKVANGELIRDANFKIDNGFKEVPSILLRPIVVDARNIRRTLLEDSAYTVTDLEMAIPDTLDIQL